MCRFIETIRILDGKVINSEYHTERYNRTINDYFNLPPVSDLKDFIAVPDDCKNGIVKCRILYNQKIESIDYSSYTIRPVSSLKLVNNDEISYSYKFEDRNRINEMFNLRATCDDVLIIKEGKVTDTSYCNVVLFDGKDWVTPDSPLLKGTKREFLLKKGLVHEKTVKAEDLELYQYISLINAMIDLKELIIPVEKIIC